jgi:hypothetical protein
MGSRFGVRCWAFDVRLVPSGIVRPGKQGANSWSSSLSLGLGITVSTTGTAGIEKPCIILWNLIKEPSDVNTITLLELMKRFCLNTQ